MRSDTLIFPVSCVVLIAALATPVGSAAAINGAADDLRVFPSGVIDYANDDSWVVPSGVSVVQVTISGGNGGSFPGSSSLSREAGGAGYTVTAGVSVTAGERIYIGLGANGGDGPTPPATSPAGSGGVSAFGIDPSGSGGSTVYGSGAGGGGASAVAVDDTIILIAGGGGGAGSAYENVPFSPPSAGFGGGYGGFGGGKGGDGTGAAQSPDGGGGLAGNLSNGTVASDLSRTAAGGGGGEAGFTRFNIGGGGGGAGQYGGLGGGGGGADVDKFASSGGGLGSSYRSAVRIPGTNYSVETAAPPTPSASIAYIDFHTSSLPVATISSLYSAALAATFGLSTSPDVWAVSPALPAGLALDPISGTITGTPTTTSTGAYTFTATKYGSGALIAAKSSTDLTLNVLASPVVPARPASPPLDVVAVAGEQQVDVSWSVPADSGTFPITNYQVSSTSGNEGCLASAPAVTCVVSGLADGTSYSFEVRALNGAGWGPWSDASDPVTSKPRVLTSILITGSRGEVRGKPGVVVTGTSTGLGMGAVLRPKVKLAGEDSYTHGTASILVDEDGAFTWQRRTGKKVFVYVKTEDGMARSNRVVIPVSLAP